MNEQSLIALVRRGEINFEQLVAVLHKPGYLTTLDRHEGLGFGKVRIDSAHQDDFDALFKLLMPGQLNDINLMAHATCKGAGPGLFTTVLFNTSVIEYEEMDALLIKINKGAL
jgi:hypothetical protein